MDSVLWIAKSGMDAHHKHIGTISNNLANANTVGFKRNRTEFEELAYQVIKQPGSPTTDQSNSPNGIIYGSGVKVANNKKIFTNGAPMPTDNALDIAINGRGFFKVQIPNQTDYAYTRVGSMELNELGQLSTNNGYLLQPPITVPEGAQKLSISQNGIVTVINSANVTEEIGTLELVDFINPTGLQPVGENLYRETIASGQAVQGTPTMDGFGSIQQFALESSNVNVVEEMVNLIEAQRSFEVSAKGLSAVDDMMRTLNNET